MQEPKTRPVTQPVDTKDARAVEVEVSRLYLEAFPGGERSFVPGAFRQLQQCFLGQNPKYQAIDVQYHDLEHTLQGALCLARLLRQRHLAGATPVISQRLFELGILAVLMHDTGYLKRPGDTEGTGAKYTAVHVTRSAEFAAECLPAKGASPVEVRAVQNMIRCTGVGLSLAAISFQSAAERIVGYALGTADLLGQMAAEDYVDKLPVLFEEFAEAAAYQPGEQPAYTQFADPLALMRNTPDFWSHFVWPRLNRDFGGLYQFLEDPYPGGPNWYLDRIEANLARVRDLVARAAAPARA